MFTNIRKDITAMAFGLPGFHSTRKLIIFTSDDWGSIRVDSPTARKRLIKLGINMENNRFDRFDILESDSDLEMLFEVLLKHKDSNGNHPVITAVTNVANPDFERIKQDNFEHYYWKNLIDTHSDYFEHSKVYEYYKKGIELGVFIPQSHGREHLNVKRWMKALQIDLPLVREAFEHKFFLLNPVYLSKNGLLSFGSAFDLDNLNEISEQSEIVKDGLNIFEHIFKYKAIYFTAPSEKFNNQLDPILNEVGISIIDAPKLRNMPMGDGKSKFKLHYIGQKSICNQYYITRNAVFEPNIDDNSDGVDSCLNDITRAFKWNKPAIISNHRAAFMGGIDASNRDKGLKALDRLLHEISKRWPDVEYIGAADLYPIMAK